MNLRKVAPPVGAVASLLTVLVLALPFVLVDVRAELLNAYYAAGPTGAVGIALFGLVGAVAFASAERGNVDRVTMAGGLVALGAGTLALAAAWWLAIDETVLFSFPQQYRWLEWHAPLTTALAVLPAAAAAAYASAVVE
ncbi:hypothetical protein GCM10027435_16360 [Haloparvum alkalitolerans]|uniref:DUF7548 family protein n=1 Tax=Haloparvum alkalitolerans TaxID=1042953 RepID=UPI003CF091DA